MAKPQAPAASPKTPGWQPLLAQAWTERGLVAWLLWPISLIYALLVAMRKGLYRLGVLDSQRLPVPVIVVGNLVAGGAGKTPVVIALAAHLRQRGLQVGVISRGYGRTSQACQEVTPTSRAQDAGDEPILIRQRTGAPVFVATARVQAASALLSKYPQTQVILSDDGLQHLPLLRDLEIGVFDDRGVGNGFLLPAGPLREPWPRPFDFVLHTGSTPAFDGFQGQRCLARHALRADGSQVLLSNNLKKPVVALAGIAQPEVFFAMLRAMGLTLASTLALPDHYDFSSWLPNEYKGSTLICTEKDAVKLWPIESEALAVPLCFVVPDSFWQALDARLDTLPSLKTRPSA
ncbi:MAG: tetraacyldisaccharide 4'-kinase [Comamonadaceae bacterium]|nr:tetraacyldisaccharide 4'-kinase [Comamonadaceae bacterium]